MSKITILKYGKKAMLSMIQAVILVGLVSTNKAIASDDEHDDSSKASSLASSQASAEGLVEDPSGDQLNNNPQPASDDTLIRLGLGQLHDSRVFYAARKGIRLTRDQEFTKADLTKLTSRLNNDVKTSMALANLSSQLGDEAPMAWFKANPLTEEQVLNICCRMIDEKEIHLDEIDKMVGTSVSMVKWSEWKKTIEAFRTKATDKTNLSIIAFEDADALEDAVQPLFTSLQSMFLALKGIIIYGAKQRMEPYDLNETTCDCGKPNCLKTALYSMLNKTEDKAAVFIKIIQNRSTALYQDLLKATCIGADELFASKAEDEDEDDEKAQVIGIRIKGGALSLDDILAARSGSQPQESGSQRSAGLFSFLSSMFDSRNE